MATEETYYTMEDSHGGLHTFPASELSEWPERKRQIDEAWERRERGEFTVDEIRQLTLLSGLQGGTEAEMEGPAERAMPFVPEQF